MDKKPTSLVIKEIEDKLVKTINESGLPAFIIKPILKGLYDEVKILCQQQYEADKAQYEASLAEELKSE